MGSGGGVRGAAQVQVTKKEKGSSVTWISVGRVQIGNSGKIMAAKTNIGILGPVSLSSVVH